ncbi:MAG TPA: hypothetical protein PKZ70_02345 [Candidatus Atribacteria bacterium]|nr:hypothetical protein [Candidatus Atribacteria bacterium]
MSLDDAMRKAGLIESLRKYAENSPGIVGGYASEVYAEIGEALEQTIRSQFDGFYREFEVMREDLVDAIKEAVKEGIKEGIKAYKQSENMGNK